MEPKLSKEEIFKSHLDGAIDILRVMSPVCGSVEDLVGMLSLAQENEGQFRLIMNMVAGVGPRARNLSA